jgi:putative aldouronate transport system permease protein
MRKKLISGAVIDNIQFALLALPAFLLILVFSYLPMGGIVLAFKNFNVQKGIFGSPWVGLKNFEFFFSSSDAWRITRNTVLLNLLFITGKLICSVAFAVLLFGMRRKGAIKFYQTSTIIPSFLSWVVVGYMAFTLLDPTRGLLNHIISAFGGTPVQWYSEPAYWPLILLLVSLWQGVGSGSIFYFASLMGIEKDYMEAASLDGASRWQMFMYVLLPFLVPLITIMTILDIGRIFRADFGLFFNVTKNVGVLYPTTDVIDTYIYRALMKVGDVGMSAAVGFFQSLVGFVLILGANLIVRKIEPDNALF